MKIQSAMEYLMTYGWAILIIAVVLGALFGLGFFNSANLAPKVGPGACQVYRPEGPGTTSFINLEGTCNNELPQYVAQFNGASSYIAVGNSSLARSGPRAAFAWMYYTGPLTVSVGTNYYSIFSYGENGPPAGALSDLAVSVNIGGAYVGFGGWGDDFYSLKLTNNDSWVFVGYSYAGGPSNSIAIYYNGQTMTENLPAALNTVLGTAEIGQRGGPDGAHFKGQIADVQVYNTSLSANEVTALYDEGIGGVPLLQQNLVGWWPLNGNANDYSGNLNNGAATSVVYTSSWTSGYSAP